MYYSYEKVTDQFTTWELQHPDYEQMPGDSARITELCTIDGVTYVHVPNGLILAIQLEQITLNLITITPQLEIEIKQTSSHVKLMEKRIMLDENVRLTKQDENTLSFLSEFTTSSVTCIAYIEKCREWDIIRAKVLL